MAKWARLANILVKPGSSVQGLDGGLKRDLYRKVI
jgi:hypothetical protein